MSTRATMHGHASGEWVAMRPGTTVLPGLPTVRGSCLRCTPVLSTVFPCLAFLDARGFLEPLIFLEIALEVFLSIETQGFLLKRRQNSFWAQCETKEGNLTITQLDLT